MSQLEHVKDNWNTKNIFQRSLCKDSLCLSARWDYIKIIGQHAVLWKQPPRWLGTTQIAVKKSKPILTMDMERKYPRYACIVTDLNWYFRDYTIKVPITHSCWQCAYTIIGCRVFWMLTSLTKRLQQILVIECRTEAAQCSFVADCILLNASRHASLKPSYGTTAVFYRRQVKNLVSSNILILWFFSSSVYQELQLRWAYQRVWVVRWQVTGKMFQAALRARKIPFNVHGVAFYRKKVAA